MQQFASGLSSKKIKVNSVALVTSKSEVKNFKQASRLTQADFRLFSDQSARSHSSESKSSLMLDPQDMIAQLSRSAKSTSSKSLKSSASDFKSSSDEAGSKFTIEVYALRTQLKLAKTENKLLRHRARNYERLASQLSQQLETFCRDKERLLKKINNMFKQEKQAMLAT